MLHQRQADGIAGIDQHAEGDIQQELGDQQSADGRNRAEQRNKNHGFLDVGLANDPHAERHVGNKGNKAHGCLDDAVVGRSQTQLILQKIVKRVIKIEIAHIGQDIHSKQQREGLGHEVSAVEDGLQGIGVFQNFAQRHS